MVQSQFFPFFLPFALTLSLLAVPCSTGLRYVKPYYFSFVSHAKGRWVGSRVFDVFCREFQAEKPEFYVSHYYNN